MTKTCQRRIVQTPRALKALLMLLALAYPFNASAQGQIDKAALIRQAKHSYYGVRASGLVEFQALVTPNWEVAVKDIASKPEALRLLNGLKFSMSFAADNAIKVNHEVGIKAPNEQTEAGFQQIFSGIEQMLSGFFDTWDLFMVNNPFPEPDGSYDLGNSTSGYSISYKEGNADVTVEMNKDFTVTLVKVVSPEFESSLWPKFMRSDKGFVLSGYSAKYLPVKGPGKVDLEIQIEHQEVQALKLPLRLRMHSVMDGEPTETELVFSDYEVKKR
jgi:hypothetical protein